ncbi:hypothetical protein NMG60_11021032 [Bertholletia excelsa]
MSMKGQSLASSSSSMTSSWDVLRLMQEQHSNEVKNADARLLPTQFTIRLLYYADIYFFVGFLNFHLLCGLVIP